MPPPNGSLWSWQLSQSWAGKLWRQGVCYIRNLLDTSNKAQIITLLNIEPLVFFCGGKPGVLETSQQSSPQLMNPRGSMFSKATSIRFPCPVLTSLLSCCTSQSTPSTLPQEQCSLANLLAPHTYGSVVIDNQYPRHRGCVCRCRLAGKQNERAVA
jgi:hypothetical protein